MKTDGISDNNALIILTKVAIAKIAEELKRASSIGTDSGKGAKVSTKLASVGRNIKLLTDVSGKVVTGIQYTIITGKVKVDQGLQLRLHVGADADGTNKIAFKVGTISSRGLGIQGLNVVDKTDVKATCVIDSIADAVAKVSAQRSTLGAIQNRLEHTIKNLDNVVENTASAESQIYDSDMAEEMVEFRKNNILANGSVYACTVKSGCIVTA